MQYRCRQGCTEDKFLLTCISPDLTQTEYRDGAEDSAALLVESLSSLLRPRQSASYGIDPRNLLITDTKAWHIWIDCVVCAPVSTQVNDEILSSDISQPLDALSLAIRVALQTSLIPHLTLEDIPLDRTYEERASIMDMQKGREPHEERLFQVDDDWVSSLHDNTHMQRRADDRIMRSR